MPFENGGEQPANEAVVTTDQNTVPLADEMDNSAVDTTESEGEEGQQAAPADDEVEIDIDGEKYRLSRKVKEAIAKPFQQDYSRKTEEIAQQRRALDEERTNVTKTAEELDAARAQVFTLNNSVKQYDDYFKSPAWGELKAQDPAQAQQIYLQYAETKNQRDTADRDLSTKKGELQERANREYGERVARVQAELPKLVPNWSADLDLKLGEFGNAHGLTSQEMRQATLQNPAFIKVLNLAYQAEQAAKANKIKQTLDTTQAAKPVTRVGGNGSAPTRRTNEPSGDALSTEEWAKRERERTRKR